MASISLHDEIFATFTQRGMVVASVKVSGVTSMGDVLRYLRMAEVRCKGLVTLKLRNLTKGWTQIRRLVIEPLARPAEAVQLTLF